MILSKGQVLDIVLVILAALVMVTNEDVKKVAIEQVKVLAKLNKDA